MPRPERYPASSLHEVAAWTSSSPRAASACRTRSRPEASSVSACPRAWRSALRNSSAERTRTVGERRGASRSCPAGSVSVAYMAVSGCVVLGAFFPRDRVRRNGKRAEVSGSNTAGSYAVGRHLEARVGPVGFPLRGLRVNAIDARGRRPAPRPGDHLLDAAGVALQHRLDGAVAAVAHPAGEAAGQRFAAQRVAVADALDAAGNAQLAGRRS